MKFYVAGRFEDKEKVREIQDKIKKEDHELTADWTYHEPFKGDADLAEEYAVEDIEGAMECDVFVLLTAQKAGAGSLLELGTAIQRHLTTGKPQIYIIGDYVDNNLFYFHPAVEKRHTIEAVLEEV